MRLVSAAPLLVVIEVSRPAALEEASNVVQEFHWGHRLDQTYFDLAKAGLTLVKIGADLAFAIEILEVGSSASGHENRIND